MRPILARPTPLTRGMRMYVSMQRICQNVLFLTVQVSRCWDKQVRERCRNIVSQVCACFPTNAQSVSRWWLTAGSLGHISKLVPMPRLLACVRLHACMHGASLTEGARVQRRLEAWHAISVCCHRFNRKSLTSSTTATCMKLFLDLTHTWWGICSLNIRRTIECKPQVGWCKFAYIHRWLVITADHMASINACSFTRACTGTSYVIRLGQNLHDNMYTTPKWDHGPHALTQSLQCCFVYAHFESQLLLVDHKLAASDNHKRATSDNHKLAASNNNTAGRTFRGKASWDQEWPEWRYVVSCPEWRYVVSCPECRFVLVNYESALQDSSNSDCSLPLASSENWLMSPNAWKHGLLTLLRPLVNWWPYQGKWAWTTTHTFMQPTSTAKAKGILRPHVSFSFSFVFLESNHCNLHVEGLGCGPKPA